MRVPILDWKSIDDPPIKLFKALITCKETIDDQILAYCEELALSGNEMVCSDTNDIVLDLFLRSRTNDKELRDLVRREGVFKVKFGKRGDYSYSRSPEYNSTSVY